MRASDAHKEACVERVLIVCGAGASSTFLALRIRAVARERGLDLVVEAGTVLDLDERLPATDVLLVGPHLAAQFDDLERRATGAGTPVALLPDDAFGQGGAEAATDLLGGLLAGRTRDHLLEAEHD
jgi:cellobiose PTS system EIIB component